MSRRRSVVPAVLFTMFVIMPIVEIYVIIQVGQVIGGWPTVALLVVESALGAWLIKREGKRAWNALQTALKTGRMPGRELADAALVLVGGTLLLTPGFITDIFGFFFVLPFTRPVARVALTRFLTRKFLSGPGAPGFRGAGEDPRTRQRPGPGSVVQGEVVD